MVNQAPPLVCICIPTFNSANTLAETLESILRQRYTNIVVLIVDNASTDNTLEIAKKISDPRIEIHAHSENIGAEGNFNRCISLAKGKYTAIYHADDIYEEDMVASQVAFLEQEPSASAVFTEATLIDENGAVTGEIKQPRTFLAEGNLHSFEQLFKTILKHSNFLICPSVMAKTVVYQQTIQAWRGTQFRTSADLDVWLRMAQAQPIGVLPKKTMRYRISRAQGSEKIRQSTERADFFKVIDFYLDQPQVQNFISTNDLFNYQCLERRDEVMRAMNALIKNQISLAKELCPPAFDKIAIQAALQNKRGALVFALSILIKLSLVLRLEWFAQRILAKLKKTIRK